MEITREADYALRTLLELASQPAQMPRTLALVARRRLIPRPFLRKIVGRLVAAGVLETKRGRQGGLLLARPPEEISILGVIEAVEGPVTVNRCVLRPEICPLQPTCPVHEVCRQVWQETVRLMSGVSLAQLAARGFALRAQAAGAH